MGHLGHRPTSITLDRPAAPSESRVRGMWGRRYLPDCHCVVCSTTSDVGTDLTARLMGMWWDDGDDGDESSMAAW